MNDARPLLDMATLPHHALCTLPTAVEPMAECDNVYVKRDDVCAPDFGGNKVRKLEFLLADATARGAREVIAFGYGGSNYVAATAWHGRKLGLHTIAMLLPQLRTDYAADNLAVGQYCGAEYHVHGTTPRLAAAAATRSLRGLLRHRHLPYWTPPGGSSALGALGFVNAAIELAEQVTAGALAAPERVYVAYSSMGTVAGLALGTAMAGLDTEIHAVRVVAPEQAGTRALHRLLNKTAARLRAAAIAVPDMEQVLARVRIRGDYFGGGYAAITPEAERARQRLWQAQQLRTDTTYSAKALACLYADHQRAPPQRRPWLYWLTFNAHGRPEGVPPADAARLPPALRELL